jgi:DNA-binding MarR family transcriptional regulator
MNFDNLQLNKQICHRLYIASNGVTRLYKPLLDELDLTYPQYVLMMALWEVEVAPVSTLQKLTKIDSGSLSLILKKLESKKYINIKSSIEDKRVKNISLTAKGLELKRLAISVPQKMFCKINKLSINEASEFIRLLDKMNDQIA